MKSCRFSTLFLVVVFGTTLTACSGGTSELETGDGQLGVTSEALQRTFTPPRGLSVSGFVSFKPKIARGPSWNNYEWDCNGNSATTRPTVGRGGNSVANVNPGSFQLGNLEQYTTSLPNGFQCSDIAGMGIAPNTSHVYTWFRTGLAAEGTSDDLKRYRTFNWSGGSHDVRDLIDADVSPNGQVYYYFRRSNGLPGVERAVGTSASAGLAQSVATLPGTNLFSVSFLPSGSIEAWYDNGTVVISPDSLFLDGTR